MFQQSSLIKQEVENRDDKQSRGECVRKGCTHPAADDSDYCAPHRDKQRAYNKAYAKRRRRRWKQQKLCTLCGGKRNSGTDSRWCARCQVRQGTKPLIKSQVENRRERLAARIIPWENSPTNAGRKRLRGGKRGRPPIDADNAKDQQYATLHTARGFAGLVFFHSDDTKMMPPIQRDAIRDESLAQLALAWRSLGSVLERYGHVVEDLLEDSDD